MACTSRNTCQHERVIFLDDDNDFVCESCGLVMQDFAFMDRAHTSLIGKKVEPSLWAEIGNKNRPFPTYSSLYGLSDGIEEDRDEQNAKWNLDTLQRVCGNFFIPSSVEEHVVHLLSTKTYQNKRTGKADRDDLLIAYALYSSCLEKDCAKTSDLISSWFQVDEKNFWCVANEFSYSSRKILPSDIFQMRREEIVILFDDISFKKMQHICTIANRLTCELSHSPSVILASVLYLYANQNECKARRVTVKEVARICNVSLTSVNQLKKLLMKKNIFEIADVEDEANGKRQRKDNHCVKHFYPEREWEDM